MLSAYVSGQIFGEVAGAGRPEVLAMHGWGRTRADFVSHQWPRPLLAVDLPGFGSTPEPADAWGTQEYARLADQLVEESMPGARVVVGHSFGGRVGLRMAAHGTRIDHLILVGTPAWRGAPSQPPLNYRLLRAAVSRGLLPQRLLDQAKQRRGSSDYLQARGVMRDVLVKAVNDDYSEILPRIGCPVTFVVGEHDTAAPPSGAEQAAELIAQAEVVVVPGSGHLLDESLRACVREKIENGA